MERLLLYIRWRSYIQKKQPQCLTLCAYLYQRVRIEGRPKAIALPYLGSIREVNDLLEQQQFWQIVEAKVSKRQWQEREKILKTRENSRSDRYFVPCPVSEKTEHFFDTHPCLVGSDRAAWRKL